MMEPGEPSQFKCISTNLPVLAIGPGRTSPDTAVRSLIAVSDDPWTDQRALLRWADDGGRWMDASDRAIQQARI